MGQQQLEDVVAILAEAGDGTEDANLCDVGRESMKDAQSDRRLARVAFWGSDVDRRSWLSGHVDKPRARTTGGAPHARRTAIDVPVIKITYDGADGLGGPVTRLALRGVPAVSVCQILTAV